MRHLLLSFLFIAGHAYGASVAFDHDGVALAGLRPGTKISWLSIAREETATHERLTIDRGIGVATPAGIIRLGSPAAHRSRWLFAGMEQEPLLIDASAPTYTVPVGRVDITTRPGEDHFLVASPAAEILYVGRRHGAWAGTASDDGAVDADHSANGVIAIPLSSLTPLTGEPAPSLVEEGDLILVIDPRSHRAGTYKVTR